MLLLLLLLLTAPPAARAQGEHRLKLKNGSNPCNGLLQVYHADRWGFVRLSSLNAAEQKVACRSTLCGEPRGTVSALLPRDATFWMQQLKCNGSEKHLWNCDFSQWSVKENIPLITERLNCSHSLSVYLDDFQCAGRVRYSTGGGQTQAGFICGDSFEKKEASVLCRSLGCEDMKEIPSWSSSLQGPDVISTSCLGEEEQLWQCAPKQETNCKKPAYVYCQAHKDVRLKRNSSNACSGEVEVKDQDSWRPENNQNQTHLQTRCKQMFCGNYGHVETLGSRTLLTCSDDVHVTLITERKPTRCYGTVHVARNRSNTPVCATQWTDANSALVCREMGCGTVMHWSDKKPMSSRSSVLDHVSCSEDDSSLWHCKSRHSLQPFPCDKNVYVICSESVGVRLSDGPSNCSGRVELFVEDQWKMARRSGFDAPAQAAVCRHLGCGDLLTGPSNTPRFSHRPDQFLDKTFYNCDAGKNLSSCSIKDNNNPSRDEKIVDITCTGHTEVFLSRGFCDGEVQVLKSSKLYWLSASSLTKPVADAVCAQRRCGSARHFESTSKASLKLPLLTLKNCPENLTSVFECQHNETVPNTTVNVTWVNCTGSKQVSLTKKCWGFVNVCEDGRCGGVNADAWPDESSKVICKSLECGENTFLPVKKPNKPPTLNYSGLHLLPNQPDVHRSTAVLCNNTDGSCTGDAAYIVCMGAYEPRFDEPRDFCSGNVQLHQEGEFLSVCDDVVKKGPTTDLLCDKLNCGTFLSNIPHHGPAKTTPYISKLTCPKNSSGFNSCTSAANNNKCSPRGLRCSKWKQVALIRGQNGCSGVVFVFSEKEPAAVSAVGWTQAETDRLCSDLNCGNTGKHQNVSTQKMIHDAQFWNGSFNCSAAERPQTLQSLWDCESHRQPEENLQLHVSCSAPPVVTISGGYSGLAQIDGQQVCSSLWKHSSSRLLCEELGYGDAVPTDNTVWPHSSSRPYHVSCESYHERLGQCQRFSAPCTDRLVSVTCTAGVKFNTSEKCGGDLLVSIGDGVWEKVCSKEKLRPNIQETMCLELGCNGPEQKDRASTKKDKMELNFSVSCADDHQHLRYCLSRKRCSETPAQLFCEGYVPPAPAPPPPPPVVPVVLGVLLVLVLCVGALLFLRFYLRRRKKSLKELLPVFWRKKQQDFESAASEEYEDVTSPDSNRLQMLVSDVGGAADKGSTSSQNYYNVDELTQPLTSGDDPPQPSEDSDGQESYDDIDKIQTKAEVHAPPGSPEGQQRPLTTEGGGEDQPEGGGPRGGGEGEAEWEAGEDPDLVLGEDDYLVPPGAEP